MPWGGESPTSTARRRAWGRHFSSRQDARTPSSTDSGPSPPPAGLRALIVFWAAFRSPLKGWVRKTIWSCGGWSRYSTTPRRRSTSAPCVRASIMDTICFWAAWMKLPMLPVVSTTKARSRALMSDMVNPPSAKSV